MVDQGPYDDFRDVTGEQAQRVQVDVGLGIQPDDSSVAYTEGMRRYRKAVERDVAKAPAGSIIEITADLPPTDLQVPD